MDTSPTGGNDGGPTERYPFNRRRLTEDTVEALDPTVDWDLIVYASNYYDAACDGTPELIDLDPPFNLAFSVVLVPYQTVSGRLGLFTVPAPGMDLPIQVREGGTASLSPIWFSDLATPTNPGAPGPTRFRPAFAAHEFLHVWECYPDLYDYDMLIGGIINCPVGAWDIMASGGMVHPSPFLKERGMGRFAFHRPRIETTDLTTLLQPYAPTHVVLTDYAFDPTHAVHYFSNVNDSGELFYFWRVTDRVMPSPHDVNFSRNLPAEGVLVMHTDMGQNPEGFPLQQRVGTHFTYNIIQADGLQELEECESLGDSGDPFPGSSGNFEDQGGWTEDTDPNSRWWGQVRSGLSIRHVLEQENRSIATFFWEPRIVPALGFLEPPGGHVVNGHFALAYRAFDFYGGTRMEFYFDVDNHGFDGLPIEGSPVGKLPGVIEATFPVPLGDDPLVPGAGIPGDGVYYFYARLIPGPGQDGLTDPSFAGPWAGLANRGRGTVGDLAVNIDQSKLETWTLTCTDAGVPGQEIWQVQGSLSGEHTHALTETPYLSDGGEVSFRVQWLGQEGGGHELAAVSNADGAYRLVDQTGPFQPHDFHSGDMVRIIGQSQGEGAIAGFYTILSAPDPSTLNLDRDPGTGTHVQYRVHSFTDGHTGGDPDRLTFITTGKTPYSQPITFLNGDVQAQLYPTIVATYPYEAINPDHEAPLTVRLDASTTLDEDGLPGAALEFTWEFGDGSDPAFPTSEDALAVVEHVYPLPGTFVVRVTAVNTLSGVSGSATVIVIAYPADTDGDGLSDVLDNCPGHPNVNAAAPWTATRTAIPTTPERAWGRNATATVTVSEMPATTAPKPATSINGTTTPTASETPAITARTPPMPIKSTATRTVSAARAITAPKTPTPTSRMTTPTRSGTSATSVRPTQPTTPTTTVSAAKWTTVRTPPTPTSRTVMPTASETLVTTVRRSRTPGRWTPTATAWAIPVTIVRNT